MDKQTQDMAQQELDNIQKSKGKSSFDHPDFLAAQKREVRLGLEGGLNVSIYAKKEFDWFQMQEIRLGLEEGQDVSTYAKAEYNYNTMCQIRKAQRDGIDILPYVKAGYLGNELKEIRRAHQDEISIDKYLSKDLYSQQLHEIRLGVKEGLDVDIYAKKDYNWLQMQELRLGLEQRLDVMVYAKPLFSYQQMREIRKGLEEGLDVKEYARLLYSAKDMSQIRGRLESLKESKEITKLNQAIQEIPADIADKSEKKTEDFDFYITSDSMQVYLLLNSFKLERPLSKEDLLHALQERGVIYGIDMEAIDTMAGKVLMNKKVLVATGEYPEQGEDGWYEYFVKTDFPKVPETQEDGSVDFTKVECFQSVKKGEPIAYYHKAETGKEGCNVFGEKIEGLKGKDLPPISGHGYALQPDKATYVALRDGRVEFINEQLILSPILELKEDVTAITGKIVFSGTVHILGSIHSGGYVESDSDVVVEQYMEAGTIKAKGDVLIKQGARSKRMCSITSGGNVSGNFFESATISAEGNLMANSIVNSQVDVSGEVIVSGNKGVVMGGEIAAIKGIRTQNLGNEAHIGTKLDVGYNSRAMAKVQDLKVKKYQILKELGSFQEAVKRIEAAVEAQNQKAVEFYEKVMEAIAIKQGELKEVQAQEEDLDKYSKRQVATPIKVSGTAYAGIDAKIDQISYRLQGDVARIAFKKRDKKVILVRYY